MKTRIGTFGLIVMSFLLGYACAQTALQRAVTQAHSDLDANQKQLVADVEKFTAELKQMVAAANIDLSAAAGLQKELLAKAAGIGIDLETSLVRAMGAVLEKTVVNNNLENEASGRLIEFFGVTPAFLSAQKEKGMTIGGLITGLGIAKAAKQKPDEIFGQYEQKKSWAQIAQSAGVKPQELIKAMEGLVPHD